jgi:DNA modification methylase
MIQGDESKSDPDDCIEGYFRGTPVSRGGDLWILRKHRVLCGSAINESSYKMLMENHRANAVFVDPPYNVPIDGHVTGNGAIQHREFAMAAGEMSKHEFTSFLECSLGLLARYSQTGSVHYVCMDWRHMGELMAAGDRAYSELLNLCIWSKDRGGMGSFYRSQHELVFVFKNGKGTHRNNVQLGKYGRNRTNVWQYPSVNTFSKQGDEGNLLALHPTVKPIALVADALLDSSARGQIVLDAFLGSGTTLMAAERIGRVCHAMELDPLYADTAIRRWQRYTGEMAVHSETGEAFNELEVKRA